MMKSEFEELAIRKNAGSISGLLYSMIERFYTSDNEYHTVNGGKYETKQQFVKRVFGGKVNTPRTILKKIIAEAQRENRYALRGCNISKKRLDEMDRMIEKHCEYCAKI